MKVTTKIQGVLISTIIILCSMIAFNAFKVADAGRCVCKRQCNCTNSKHSKCSCKRVCTGLCVKR